MLLVFSCSVGCAWWLIFFLGDARHRYLVVSVVVNRAQLYSRFLLINECSECVCVSWQRKLCKRV